MDIIFKGRRTDVQERFRSHASAKLSKIEKLDHKAIRIDVEVSQERNPRLSGRRERVELTIRSRGPVIRAEAAADDRYVALDLALAKLEGRLRRSGERRKAKRSARALSGNGAARSVPAATARAGAAPVLEPVPDLRQGAWPGLEPEGPEREGLESDRSRDGGQAEGRARTSGGQPLPEAADAVVPIQMEGDGPVVVREKHHRAAPMTVDQALLEMELVGHDFYLFRDSACGRASVVYRRRGYQYGLIRLVENGSGAGT